MRKLVRGAMPSVLADKQRQKKQTPTLCWADVNAQERAGIWVALEQMQGGRCAYCERHLAGVKKQHIEHFRKREDHPAGVFEWQNLFGSCDDKNSCGKHKDQKAENWQWSDLIKPDQDEPDEYLQFFSDGSIRAREKLTPAQQRRAKETLRVFNLNQHQALCEMRNRAVNGWLCSLEDFRNEWMVLFENGQCTEEEVMAEVANEVQNLLSKTAHLPFATAIRHSLTWQGS